MATSYTGLRVQDTYNAIIKIGDNSNLTATPKLLSDGLGNDSPLYLSGTRLGVGISPTYQFQTSGNAKIGGNLIIAGDLTVNGSTTIVDSTIVAIGDNMIEMAKDNVANTMDIGWYGTIVENGTKYVGMKYDAGSGVTTPTFELGYGTVEPSGTAEWTVKGKLVIGAIDSTGGSFSGQITIPQTPTADGHAASKKYVDDQIADVDTAKRLEVDVKNVHGATLAKGTVVHPEPTGTLSGNVIEVVAADANSGRMPAIGVLNEALLDDAEGKAVMFGTVQGIDTSSFSVGDELYVSATAGQFTATKPTATTEEVQKIAIVVKSHASNGLIKVFGAGRSNDVPNLLTRDITIDGADFYFGDADQIRMGDPIGLRIQHASGGHSYIDGEVGNLYIRAEANDSDMIFQADNGAGGNITYFRLDGGLATHDGTNNTARYTVWGDNSRIALGDSQDLQIYHDGTDSHIINTTGDLTIDSQGDDLILKAADDALLYVQGTDIAIQAVGDGKVGLRYNNVEKLRTESNGVTIFEDLLLSGTTPFLSIDGSTTAGIQIHSPSSAKINMDARDSGTGAMLHKWNRNDNNTAYNAYYENWYDGDSYHSIGIESDLWRFSNGIVVSGGATFAGNVTVGNDGDITMDSTANGQLMIDGNGYQGAIALDGTAMYVYHNSSSRDLILGTNETARLTIDGSNGNATFAGDIITNTGILNLDIGNVNIGIEVNSDDSGSYIRFNDGVAANRWYAGVQSGDFGIYNNDNEKPFEIDSNNNATFAGDVTVNNILNTSGLSFSNGEGDILDSSTAGKSGIGNTFRWVEQNSSSNGSTWKKVCDVVLNQFFYDGVQMEVIVYQPDTNWGDSASLIKNYYSVAFRGDQSDTGPFYNDVLIYGKNADLLRGYKTGTYTYELQARSNNNNKDLVVEYTITSKNNAEVTPTKGYEDGTTTGGTAYTASQNSNTTTKFAGSVEFSGATFDDATIDDLRVEGILYLGAGANATGGGYLTHKGSTAEGVSMKVKDSDGFDIYQVWGNGGEASLSFEAVDEQIKLYYSGDEKLNTNSNGIIVTGETESTKFIATNGNILQLHQSSWNTGNTDHYVLFNSWRTNTGDYLLVKSSGNQNGGNGAILISDGNDGRVYFGKHGNQSQAVDSATAPLDTTYAYIGGNANYFSSETTFADHIYLNEDKQARFKDSNGDVGLRIQHNGSNSFIDSEVGHLYLRAEANDSSISLQADDGSGGNAEYFKIDGTDQRIYVNKLMRLGDDVQLRLGDNNDLRLYHNSTSGNNNIENHTGSLYITNYTDDEDIVFRNDNGSGDVVEYFRLDGSTNTIPFGRSPHIVDNLKLYFGNDTANDASIKWDSTASQLFIDGVSKFLDVLYAQSHIIQSSSSSKFINGSYLEIGTGASNTAQLTFNADYDGDQTDTYTPNYSGSSSAGMSIIKMPSGGVGGLNFYVKNHGTTSGSHALSTFTKILELNQSGNSTFAGEVTATEYNLPSSGMLDWANGDARIVEGLVNNYSLSFQTWDGSALNTALRLDGNNTATFAGNVQIGGDTIFDGYAQVYGFLYTRNHLRVLNAAGNGWHNWATRGGGKYDLNVNNITSAAINATTVGVTNIVTNKIVKFNGTILDDSNITDDGTTVSVAGNLSVSGDVSVTGKDIVYKGTNIDRGSVVFEITEFDSTNSLRDKLNNETAGITRVDDSTAPDGGCWQMADIYRSFTIDKYIKVHAGQEYIFETWIKFVSGTDTDQRLYMGASFYDENKSYLGNSQRYWGESALQVDANTNNDGWYHTAGTLGPTQSTSTGNIPTAARWMKLIMLVNYSSNANTIRLCGTRCYHSGGIGKQMITSLYRKKIGSTAGSNAGDWVGTEVIDSSGNFYINSSSTSTSFLGDANSNLTIANNGNINFRANSSSINSMIISSTLIDINENVDIDPTQNAAALSIGRYTGQPNIKANTDDGGYMMMDSSGGWGAINWYSTDNIALALGGGRVLVGAGTTNLDTSYRMTINGSLKIGDTGNVTSEADTQLAIRNNADGFIRMVRSSVRTWDHKIDSGGHYKIRNADGSYDVLSLTDDNNVGIGVGSPTHNLQIGSGNTVNSFNVGGSYGKTEWTRSYVASNTTIAPILDHLGNNIPDGGAYRVTGHIDGTGTDQSSMAVFWNQNGTWFCNVTAQSGTTSNHIQFLVSGGVPSVKTYHANNYTIRCYHERIILQESGTDNSRHYFGSDSFMQMIGSQINLNYAVDVNNNMTFGDNNFATFGASGDLRIYHNGSNSVIDTTTGSAGDLYLTANGSGHDLYLRAADNIYIQPQGGENGIICVGNGEVNIYHNSVKKIMTQSTGAIIYGELQLNDANTKLLEGSGNAVRIQTNSGYIDIGPMNSSWSHFQTDRPQFYFNKQLGIDGNAYPYNSLNYTLGTSSNLWNRTYTRYIESHATQARVKFSVWSGSTYGFGMQQTYNFGGLNGYAITCQMSNSTSRGYWWGDTGHSNSQGAFACTTQGKFTIAHSLRLGYGESDTTTPGATYRLDVSGKIRATDDILAYSDARVKTNINTIDNALEKVTKLRGVSYNRIDSEDTSNKIGVIAQEVNEVLPEIVTKDNEGMYSVAYSKMAGLFIEAIKDLKAEINELKEEIKELKSK